jgi:hypothetical protein
MNINGNKILVSFQVSHQTSFCVTVILSRVHLMFPWYVLCPLIFLSLYSIISWPDQYFLLHTHRCSLSCWSHTHSSNLWSLPTQVLLVTVVFLYDYYWCCLHSIIESRERDSKPNVQLEGCWPHTLFLFLTDAVLSYASHLFPSSFETPT